MLVLLLSMHAVSYYFVVCILDVGIVMNAVDMKHMVLILILQL